MLHIMLHIREVDVGDQSSHPPRNSPDWFTACRKAVPQALPHHYRLMKKAFHIQRKKPGDNGFELLRTEQLLSVEDPSQTRGMPQ